MRILECLMDSFCCCCCCCDICTDRPPEKFVGGWTDGVSAYLNIAKSGRIQYKKVCSI